MKPHRHSYSGLRRVTGCTLLLGLQVLTAAAQVSFQTIPVTGDLVGLTSVSALSKDGSALSGTGWSLTNWGPKAFVWTKGGGTAPLVVPSANSSSAFAVNSNGTVVVGWCFKSDGGAFIWRNGSFGTVSQNPGAVIRAVTSDGSTAVGANPPSSTSEAGVAAQWNVSSGTSTSLGNLPGSTAESEVLAISGDNSTTVGWSKSTNGIQAFRRRSGTMTGLGDLGGGKFFSQATAVSRDGSVVVGRSESAQGMQAFRWTSTNGMTALGDFPGGALFSEATGVSGDGLIIVGVSASAADNEVFIWEPRRGLRSLAALIRAAGVDLSGWRFTYCKPVISEDGNVVAGQAIDPGYQPVIWRFTGLRSILGRLPAAPMTLRPSDIRFHLKFVAEAGFRYQVQQCAQLGDTSAWENAGPATLGSGVEQQVSFDRTAPSCFWRLIVTTAAP